MARSKSYFDFERVSKINCFYLFSVSVICLKYLSLKNKTSFSFCFCRDCDVIRSSFEIMECCASEYYSDSVLYLLSISFR